MSITWFLWSLRQGIPCKSCQTDPLLPTFKRILMSGLPFIELLVHIKRRAQNYIEYSIIRAVGRVGIGSAKCS